MIAALVAVILIGLLLVSLCALADVAALLTTCVPDVYVVDEPDDGGPNERP